MPRTSSNQPRKRNRRRRGALTVEFAITVPILFLFVFGCFEFSRICVIRSTVENAAYEGARTGIIPGATKAQCEAAATSYLQIIGVNDATVTCNTLNDTTPTVTVSVVVPINLQNGYLSPQYFIGDQLGSTISLPREGF